MYLLNMSGDSEETKVWSDENTKHGNGKWTTNTVDTGTINIDKSKTLSYIRFSSSGIVYWGGGVANAYSWVSKLMINI